MNAALSMQLHSRVFGGPRISKYHGTTAAAVKPVVMAPPTLRAPWLPSSQRSARAIIIAAAAGQPSTGDGSGKGGTGGGKGGKGGKGAGGWGSFPSLPPPGGWDKVITFSAMALSAFAVGMAAFNFATGRTSRASVVQDTAEAVVEPAAALVDEVKKDEKKEDKKEKEIEDKKQEVVDTSKGMFEGVKGAAASVGRALHIVAEDAAEDSGKKSKKKNNKKVECKEGEEDGGKKVYYIVAGSTVAALAATGAVVYCVNKYGGSGDKGSGAAKTSQRPVVAGEPAAAPPTLT